MNPTACKKNNMLLNMVYFRNIMNTMKPIHTIHHISEAKEENIVFINTMAIVHLINFTFKKQNEKNLLINLEYKDVSLLR